MSRSRWRKSAASKEGDTIAIILSIQAQSLFVVVYTEGVGVLPDDVERLLAGLERFGSKMLHRRIFFKNTDYMDYMESIFILILP